MEFHEKLQELRKSKGMTQEELAADLYISRTAVSKWESGRGYPNLDSLKEISNYFNISIDDLLSADTLMTIAEKDKKSNLRKSYDFMLGIMDLFSFLLIILPLYPKTVDGFVYSVNLLTYTQTADRNISLYWIMFMLMIATGVIKLILMKCGLEKSSRIVSDISIGSNIVIVVLMALFREAYATVLVIVFLVIKMMLLLKKASFYNIMENGVLSSVLPADRKK